MMEASEAVSCEKHTGGVFGFTCICTVDKQSRI